jgi:hypothetical protein
LALPLTSDWSRNTGDHAAFREGDGATTVTSCEDKAGVDDSSKRAADWISENATTSAAPPEITEGSAFLQF